LPTQTRQTGSRARSSDLSLEALAIASIASLVATVVLSRFGLASTLVGAALSPAIVTVVKELARRPAHRIVRPLAGETSRLVHRPSGAPQPTGGEPPPPPPENVPHRPVFRESWWSRVRWKPTLVIAGVAFAICVAFFTVPEMLLGESLTSDRGSTFLSDSPQTTPPPVTTATTGTATVTNTVATTTVTATATATVPSLTTTTPTAPPTTPTAPPPTTPTAPTPTAGAP
jgi:hypothetical protein